MSTKYYVVSHDELYQLFLATITSVSDGANKVVAEGLADSIKNCTSRPISDALKEELGL